MPYATPFHCPFLFTSACTQNEPTLQAASFQVTQDGTAWQAVGTATYDWFQQAFSIVSSRNITGNQTQTVSLSFTVWDAHTPVASSLIGVASRQLVGGDGITSPFRNADAFGITVVQMTRFAMAQRIIEGQFTADLQQEYTQQPAVLRLTEGSFRIKYGIGPSAQ